MANICDLRVRVPNRRGSASLYSIPKVPHDFVDPGHGRARPFSIVVRDVKGQQCEGKNDDSQSPHMLSVSHNYFSAENPA
jgi:hypothetical protein